jgi:hypothetical protein
VLPPVSPDQAERVESAIVMHPGAIRMAKEMKATLPPREGQAGLLQCQGQHFTQPPAGMKSEELGVRPAFEKRLTSAGLGPPCEAIFEAATFNRLRPGKMETPGPSAPPREPAAGVGRRGSGVAYCAKPARRCSQRSFIGGFLSPKLSQRAPRERTGCPKCLVELVGVAGFVV